jgi:predicted transcriptional regulator
MKLSRVREILNCRVVCGEDRLDVEVSVGCGADLMSDVLAFIKPEAVLLTGLTNVQSVRTADVADVRAIIYVRGKWPDQEAIDLARENGIVVLATHLPMFEACGRLFACGLSGFTDVEEVTGDARGDPLHSAV